MTYENEYSTAGILSVRRAFAKAARKYGSDRASLTIPELLSDRLLQRLDSLAIEPAIILDIGSFSSSRTQQLATRYPKVRQFCSLWSEEQPLALNAAGENLSEVPGSESVFKTGVMKRLLRQVSRMATGASSQGAVFASDPCQLPLADQSVDLVVASQVVPWCYEPGRLFTEAYRVLAPGGAFFWSGVGPDTLREYRALWSGLDGYPHVFGLHDMHDLGDDMLKSGFDSPVMDRENLTVNYTTVGQLETDLRAAGAFNLASGRRRGLLASSMPRRLAETPGGGLDVTIELVQGHGWRSASKPGLAAPREVGGEVRIPVSAVKMQGFKKP